MATPPRLKDREVVVHQPQWDKIMAILASPAQAAVFADNWSNSNQSVASFESMDGAWDQTQAQKGIGMRRVAADIGKTNGPTDIPSGFVFVCECGFPRRVVDSEHAFSCERPNGKGQRGCGILWQKDVYADEEDLHPTSGLPIMKPKLEKRTAPNKREYLMPIIKGYTLSDWRYLEQKARDAMSEEQLVALDEQEGKDRDAIRNGKVNLSMPKEGGE